MRLRIFVLFLFSSLLSSLSHAEGQVHHRSDWGEIFSRFDARGTIVVADERTATRSTSVFNETRANERYSPASTFKIPHTLFALDAGVVRDEFQVFRWDGVTRDFAPHNMDQDLRSSMRNSAVWVYEMFATEIGEASAREYLGKLNYGNADPASEVRIPANVTGHSGDRDRFAHGHHAGVGFVL